MWVIGVFAVKKKTPSPIKNGFADGLTQNDLLPTYHEGRPWKGRGRGTLREREF